MPKVPDTENDRLVIRNVEFIGGMAERHGWRPESSLPEVAFAGRSNVGKSSLLNTLVRRKSFARVSRTPGRTREINFFRINNGFVLVDLPGYGYARVSKERKAEWMPLLGSYLRQTSQLRGIVLLLVSACAASAPYAAAQQQTLNPIADDTTGRGSVPVGYGTLRQDEIAIRMELPGLIVRAIPLDENLIRLLTPDSYRALRELQESNKQAIAAVTRRTGGRSPDLWYVSFYGVQPDVHFSPMELVITSSGRDFRPLEVIPLSSGFGEQRLKQREAQSALYLFDEAIDLDQPLSVSFQNVRDDSWEQILTRVERERALVRARASHPSQ